MSCRQLSPEHEKCYREHLDLFSREPLVVGDQEYAFTEADLDEIAYGGRFWSATGGLNSSVISGAVSLARQRFRPALARAQIIELVASTLQMTAAQVESSLDWTANYMAWHDGGSVDENHPYPTSEP